MSDKLVLVAVYGMPVEAQLARGRLEAEGIRAIVTGGDSVNLFSGVQGLGGRLHLQVAETDAERAVQILQAYSGEDDEDDGAPPDEDALWLCPLCGDAVSDDLSVCPACETPRPAPEKSPAVTTAPRRNPASQDVQERPEPKPEKITSDTPLEAVPSAAESELDLPNLETLVGDDLVRRAFLSALFPILIPYSFWLLFRLGFYSGKISPRMTRRLYWTYAIDAVWFFALLFGGLRLVTFLTFRRPF